MMKKSFKFIFVLTVAVFVSPAAWSYTSGMPSSLSTSGLGDWMISIVGTRLTENQNFGGVGTSSAETITGYYDGKVGYVGTTGIYVGLAYSSGSFTKITNSTTTDSLSAYGISAGYHFNGFFVDGTYYISSTYNFSNGNSATGGTSDMVELGYDFNLTSIFFVGAEVVYKSFNWNSQTVNNVVASGSNSLNNFYPALTLGFTF